MAIKLIKNHSKQNHDENGNLITLCDDSLKNFSKDQLREERDIEIKDLKKNFDAFNTARGKLPGTVEAFKNKILLSANFPVDDIQRIIDQNDGNLSFLRLYMGIDEYGDHILCVAPVDKNKKVITTDGTIYVAQCCGYPPNTKNFKGDPILGI